MTFKSSPLNNTSIELEIEAIKRFRTLVLVLSPQCRIFRELNSLDTVLCLDFVDCPQDLKRKKEEWEEVIILLAISCDYLGIAKRVLFKNGERIVGRMTLDQIA